jgi:hypothetical protein
MRLLPDIVIAEDRWYGDHVIMVSDGRISNVAPVSPGDRTAGDVTRLPGKALLPGTVNAHCHTFQSLLRGLGDDLDFMAWRDRVLYPYSTRLDHEDIYLGAAFAFAEMLLHGATTCVDFFYLQETVSASPLLPASRSAFKPPSSTTLNGCRSFHSGTCGASALTRSRAKAPWTYIGCSVHSVPSLSNTAMRWAGGTQSAPPFGVTFLTKFTDEPPRMGLPSMRAVAASTADGLAPVLSTASWMARRAFEGALRSQA